MRSVAPHVRSTTNAAVPSFAELHRIDDQFFRRGHSGTHHDEMTAELHQLFWSQPDNTAAMALLDRGQSPFPFGRRVGSDAVRVRPTAARTRENGAY